jgi:NADPH:quinone reductase-like Zn-dependent oxidoreductase
MNAIVLNEFGDRSKLIFSEVDKPGIGEGEVLIRVKAAGINPVDTKIREGLLQARMPNHLPIILGWDMAGVVVETGYAARRFCVGDEVFAYARRPAIQNGTYAEYISIPECYIAHKPDSLSFEEAASVPLAALTAYQCVIEKGNLARGQHVLILGASGGVGSYAVQFAKILGAVVYAVAGEGRESYLKSIGADHVIDYSKGDFKEQLKQLLPSGADLAFDCVGKDSVVKAYECVKENGILVSILAQVNQELADKNKIQFKYHFVEPNVRQLDSIGKWIDEGKVKVHVQSVYDLRDVAKAHEQIETGHTLGKIVLRIG